jgi:histidyl-tRNA synthetase
MKSILKGFNDYTEKEAKKRAKIKRILIENFEKYCFEPTETPIIEYEEFVKEDNSQDETVSDIFKLKDKGKRKLALRYEFTFQLKRIAKNKKLPYKRYQIGEVFRDEPVSSNRFRQFTQADVDIVGSSIKDEAEILALTKDILEKLGITFTIYINNRKLLNEILSKFKIKNKEQAIREFDKLDKLPEKQVKSNLKKLGAEKFLGILKQNPEFFRKYKSYSEIEELKKYCKYYGVDVKFQPNLARGLSYYNGTIFEIKTKKMNETIAAGGSYLIDGKQSTGISFGLERLSQLAKVDIENKGILINSLDKDKDAIKLAQKLRKKDEKVILFCGKPSKALEYANSYNFEKVIFVGKDEVKKSNFKVKDMKTGGESPLKI